MRVLHGPPLVEHVPLALTGMLEDDGSLFLRYVRHNGDPA